MSSEEHESISAEMASMQTRVSGIESGMARIEASVGSLARSLQERGQTNWAVIIPAMALVAVMIAGAWAIVQLQTQTAIGPILTQNQVSIQDRTEMRAQLSNITTDLSIQRADQKTNVATTTSALTEIETQFRASDQIRNAQTANTNRFLSLLWQKAYSEPFPAEVFYPEISRTK